MFRHAEKQLAIDYPILGSSVDSSKVALRWKSVAVGVVPLVIVLLSYFGISVTENELLDIINHVIVIFTSITFIWGWIRGKIPQQ